jgi:hypothetical protein
MMPDKDKEEVKLLAKDNIKQTIDIYKESQYLHSKIIFNYCLIGRNFKSLKDDFNFSNEALDKEFKDYKGLSKSMRNNYIKLHNLSMDFTKIMHATAPIRDITKYIKYLKECMTNDKEFDWR